MVVGTASSGSEHDADLFYESGRDGAFFGGRGATNTAVFEAYVEHSLAPSLKAGQVVVMDNLAAHKSERVGELIKERGCELLYLPAYSPDLNPIEQAFSKIKSILRRLEARSREILIEAMGVAISEVSAEDACGFFEGCGYTVPVQPL